MNDVTANEGMAISFHQLCASQAGTFAALTKSVFSLQFVRCYLKNFTIEELPVELLSKIKYESHTGKFLKFKKKILTDFFFFIFLDSSRKLVLCDNEITKVDLRVRNISRESFSKKLVNLEELYLSANLLKNIPQSFNEVSHCLKILDLRSNRLTSPLSSVLFSLSQLEVLDLSCNNLTFLPPDIARLWKLRRLYLFNNDIRHLPLEIGALKHLQELLLQGNLLRRLPLTLSKLTNTLTNLKVGDNPLVEPPKNVIEEGIASIMTYLSECISTGEPCYRLKLLLLGQPDVGKTVQIIYTILYFTCSNSIT